MIEAKAGIRPYIDIHEVPIHLPLRHWKMPKSSIGEILTRVSSTDGRPLEPNLASYSAATHHVAERCREEEEFGRALTNNDLAVCLKQDMRHPPPLANKTPWTAPKSSIESPQQLLIYAAATTDTANASALAWIYSTTISPFTVSFLILLVCLLFSFDDTAFDTSTATPPPTRTRAPRRSLDNRNNTTHTARILRVCAYACYARPMSIFVSPKEQAHRLRADALTERSPIIARSLLARAGLDAQAP